MGAKIKSIEYYLPDNILSNDDLANEFNRWEPSKIEKKIGIKERHIVSESETAADLGYEAAEKLLANTDRDQIDALLFCTQSPDYFLPASSCVLQEKLKLRTSCATFDFNQGCSGFIYGLAIAKSFINTNLAKNVLLITAETYSKHIYPKDLANKTIFGDGAAATLITEEKDEFIQNFVLGTDGRGYRNLIVPNGAARNHYQQNAEVFETDSGDQYTENNLFMNGPEIFNFTIEAVPKTISQCLSQNNKTIDDIDFFIFHQANKFMIDYLRKKISIPEEKFYSNMLHTGNTVSSTIPIALKDAMLTNQVKSGNTILLCGFGVGYSWGATIINI
jgi:3-oxoacyl-[acyl-carrier-protein] synthase-3